MAVSSTHQAAAAVASKRGRRRMPTTGAADDCFSCKRRRVPCDRRRPYCGQCVEMGKDCSGYRTTLTWGVGVASRGKLRGMTLPVASSSSALPRPERKPRRALSVASAGALQGQRQPERQPERQQEQQQQQQQQQQQYKDGSDGGALLLGHSASPAFCPASHPYRCPDPIASPSPSAACPAPPQRDPFDLLSVYASTPLTSQPLHPPHAALLPCLDDGYLSASSSAYFGDSDLALSACFGTHGDSTCFGIHGDSDLASSYPAPHSLLMAGSAQNQVGLAEAGAGAGQPCTSSPAGFAPLSFGVEEQLSSCWAGFAPDFSFVPLEESYHGLVQPAYSPRFGGF